VKALPAALEPGEVEEKFAIENTTQLMIVSTAPETTAARYVGETNTPYGCVAPLIL
jgi:hypothetical protein